MKIDPKQNLTCISETMTFLGDCRKSLDAGEALHPDPFYARNSLLTKEIVEKVISEIEREINHELRQYPGFHRTAQGVPEGRTLVSTEFDKLPYVQQLAIVQGIDRIFQKHRMEPEVEKAAIEAEALVAEFGSADSPYSYDED